MRSFRLKGVSKGVNHVKNAGSGHLDQREKSREKKQKNALQTTTDFSLNARLEKPKENDR